MQIIPMGLYKMVYGKMRNGASWCNQETNKVKVIGIPCGKIQFVDPEYLKEVKKKVSSDKREIINLNFISGRVFVANVLLPIPFQIYVG